MRLIAVLLLLSLPFPALALSCMPHVLTETFQRTAASDQSYIVVHGRLTFDKKQLPRAAAALPQDTPPMTRLPALLRGRSLSGAGFSLPFDRSLTLEVQCFGPWCASAKSGQDVLAFVRRSPEGYFLRINPCGGDMFSAPQPAMIRKVKRCFGGGACTPPAAKQ